MGNRLGTVTLVAMALGIGGCVGEVPPEEIGAATAAYTTTIHTYIRGKGSTTRVVEDDDRTDADDCVPADGCRTWSWRMSLGGTAEEGGEGKTCHYTVTKCARGGVINYCHVWVSCSDGSGHEYDCDTGADADDEICDDEADDAPSDG